MSIYPRYGAFYLLCEIVLGFSAIYGLLLLLGWAQ
jgi:hypothetical protein